MEILLSPGVDDSGNAWAYIPSPRTPASPSSPKTPASPDRAEGLVGRTNALESLVISGWVRGLSDRDIEAALAEVLGPEAALSRSTVSRICQRIKDEFQTWRTRDLSGVRLDYLFLDGSHFKMHPGAPAEPVLCVWGIDTDGKPVFVG